MAVGAKRRFVLAFAACWVTLLVPLWSVKYFPAPDYPNHLARAFILTHLFDPAFQFSSFYAADWGPYPYLTMDLVLIGLQQIVPVRVAGHILITIGLLVFALSSYWFLHKSNPTQDYLAFWVLLIAYNPFLLSGFVNWFLSIGLCFAVISLWLVYLERNTWAFWICLLVLASCLYMTHLVGFAVAWFVITTHSLLARVGVRKLVASWLLFSPGAACYLWWRSHAGVIWTLEVPTLRDKLVGLTDPVRSYSKVLDVVTMIILAGTFLALWWRNPEFRWNRRWLFVLGLLLVVYSIFPVIPGTWADIRLMTFIYILMFAVARVGTRARRVAPIIILLFIVRTAHLGYSFSSMQAELKQLAASFCVMKPSSRVLPILESRKEPFMHRAYATFWAYGVIEKGLLSPYMFHSGEALQPQQLRLLKPMYRAPGIGWLEYEGDPDWSRVQQEYDYVWVYNSPRFHARLRQMGRPIYHSKTLMVFRLSHSHTVAKGNQ